MLLFISFLISSLIVGIDGQNGQPITGGGDRFSFECQQTEPEVTALPNNREFEVSAGKSFVYSCEFFIDTRDCEHNPTELGCGGIEVVWTLPKDLALNEKGKGPKRKTEDTVIEKNLGYIVYRSKLSLHNFGSIQNGQYGWQLNDRFQMRTLFSNSFTITTIDILQLDESCVYADSCQSNQCVDGVCVRPADKSLPWIIVGALMAVVIVVIIAIAAIIFFVNRKHQRFINTRF